MADSATPNVAEPAKKADSTDATSETERKLAAWRAALASQPDFAASVDFLELVFVRARASGYGDTLVKWIDPKIDDKRYIAARDSVISDVIQAGSTPIYTLNEKRAHYRKQIEIFVRMVGIQARQYALSNLSRQTQLVYRLLVTTRPLVKELHRAARAVRDTADDASFELPTMSPDDAREAVGETRKGERRTAATIAERLQRLFYIHLLRQGPEPAEAGTRSIDAVAYKKLLELMTHPRGVEIVDAFGSSSERGWNLVSNIFSDTLKSIVELQQKLTTDEDLVWRFPPAVVAGVASMGLRNRPGITQFALAWGKSRKTALEEGLDIAGNVLFVVDLLGGPLGSAVSDVIGFVIDVIGTAVSFMRDVEQDQAAASTAFAARAERLSHGSNKMGTVLQGLAAVVSGLAVPGSLRKLTGIRSKEIVHLPQKDVNLKRPEREFDRAVDRRATEFPEASGANRGLRKTAPDEPRGMERLWRKTPEEPHGLDLSRNKATDPRSISGRQSGRTAGGDVSRSTDGNAITAGPRRDPLSSAPPEPVLAMAGPAKKKTGKNQSGTHEWDTTPKERATTFDKTKKEVRGEMTEILQKPKISMKLAEARKIAAKLRSHLPTTMPRTLEKLKELVKDMMDVATRQAHSEGLRNIDGNNLLGNRAHRYTEYLLDQINLQLAHSRMRLGIFAEQFRGRRRKHTKWILSENKRGWLGIDAVLYEDGLAKWAIDLKTGDRDWTRDERAAILRRFGLTDNQLETHHPTIP